jgi:photosystem II stability/assembly factor-like uncharacterized protein
MRRFAVWGCAFAFLLIGLTVSAQWKASRPDDFTRKDGVEGDLRAVAFADDLHGWAVGDNSVVLRTEDGGKTWVKQDLPMRPTGGAGGGGRPDGAPPVAAAGAPPGGAPPPGPPGDAPAPPQPPAGAPPAGGGGFGGFGGGGNVQLWKLFVADANTAWVVGNSGALFSTKDGGKTWERSAIRGGSRLVEVQFVTPEVGFVAGDNATLAKTTDGGKTWTPVLSGPRARAGDNRTIFEGLAFPTPEVGWAVGSSGTVMTSTDGGVTWEKPETEIDASENLYAVTFTSETDGWIVGQEATILHTTDGGKTWKRVKNDAQDDYYDLYDISFAKGDPTRGWVCGDGGLLLTTKDGGKTWKKEKSGVNEAIHGIAATPSSRAFAVGAWGVILQTP